MDNTTRARKLAKWLRRQDWFNQWFDNLCKCYPEPEDYGIVQSFCEGYEGEFTLEQAFNWKGSPEGLAFWTRKNADLIGFINAMTE